MQLEVKTFAFINYTTARRGAKIGKLGLVLQENSTPNWGYDRCSVKTMVWKNRGQSTNELYNMLKDIVHYTHLKFLFVCLFVCCLFLFCFYFVFVFVFVYCTGTGIFLFNLVSRTQHFHTQTNNSTNNKWLNILFQRQQNSLQGSRNQVWVHSN